MSYTNEELRAAAEMVERQAWEAKGAYGIPVDPEVADYMGAFVENAITLDDMLDDDQLAVNDAGEVVHE